MKTYNRGKLLKLAKAGKLIATRVIHDGLSTHGAFRVVIHEHPFPTEQPENTVFIPTWDFKSRSGRAWTSDNETISLDVCGNYGYEFKVT